MSASDRWKPSQGCRWKRSGEKLQHGLPGSLRSPSRSRFGANRQIPRAERIAAAAERLGYALLDDALSLTHLPGRGVAVRGRPGYRRILHRPWFLLYYRIDEEQRPDRDRAHLGRAPKPGRFCAALSWTGPQTSKPNHVLPSFRHLVDFSLKLWSTRAILIVANSTSPNCLQPSCSRPSPRLAPLVRPICKLEMWIMALSMPAHPPSMMVLTVCYSVNATL
jgi:hypothetical protein